MKPAPISLLEYFATDMALSANPLYDSSKGLELKDAEYNVDVRVDAAPSESGPARWQVTLEIGQQTAPETNFPYSFRLVLVGFFEVARPSSPEQDERFVKIQGASVLYGMAREIVRAITGRGPHSPVMLPTVSFYEPAVASSPVEN